MQDEQTNDVIFMWRTRNAYIWTRVLDTPFWGLFNLLPFILYKDLHATPFQLALIITLKPLVSILSSYWSNHVHLNPGRLVSNIISARWLAYLPFLFFPLIHNTWYLIVCFGLFMFLQVGMMPAWMELLKQNVPEKTREKVFSYTQAFGYLGGGLLPFAVGWILDKWMGSWIWMFPLVALLALTAHFWHRLILVRIQSVKRECQSTKAHPILKPWKSAFELLNRRRDFAKFQVGFMLMGGGLMIIQPSLPIFFVDQLHLSYTELAVAVTLCKGIGFAFSSPIWVRLMQRVDIFHFGALIALLATLFPLFLMMAQSQLLWLYLAYLAYGLMQAGSELNWNMSGPIFAKNEDSSPYSSVNVIAVGIRGIFIPTLGAYCLTQFGASAVIMSCGVLCLLAAIQMGVYSRQAEKIIST